MGHEPGSRDLVGTLAALDAADRIVRARRHRAESLRLLALAPAEVTDPQP